MIDDLWCSLRSPGSGFKGSGVQGSKVQGFKVQRFRGSKVQGFKGSGFGGSEVDPSFNYLYGINGIGKKREAINPER